MDLLAIDHFFARTDKALRAETVNPITPFASTLRERVVRRTILVGGRDIGFHLTTRWEEGVGWGTYSVSIEIGGRFPFIVNYDPYVLVTNIPGSPTGVKSGEIEGSHYYSWHDNKHLFHQFNEGRPTLPQYARPLPAESRSYQSIVDWLLIEAKIKKPSWKIPVPKGLPVP